MITIVKKTNAVRLFIVVAALVLSTACSKGTPKETAKETPQAAPAAETVDLAQPAEQAPDLFKQPLQPNPLALNATDVVVTVNGENITHGEIMQGVQMNMMQMSRQVPKQKLAQMTGQIYKNVTDTLVANVLLTQAAEKSSLTVNDDELAKEISNIESNAPAGSSLTNALAKNNINFDDWKKDLRKQLLVRKLVDEKTADIAEATATEIATFYQDNTDSFKVPENVTASHILVAFTPEDTDATKAQKKKKIEKIRAELLAGGDFAEIASKESDGPSKKQGGSLGTFTRGQMVPEFDKAAFAQDVGAIGDVIETQFGYHIIKVTDHKQARVRPLSEVKDQLQQYLTGQKKQKALLAYIDKLKAKANIKKHTPDFDAADKTNSVETNSAE